jgi:hypothetical protein
MRRKAFSLLALATSLVVSLCFCPVSAQTVSGDDLAAVMISADAVPGFHVIGDTSPTPRRPTATNEQRTRVFVADGSTAEDYTLLSVIVTVPTPYAVCLPFFPGNIANGDVLGLNGDKPNFQEIGSLGVGDVDIFGSWSDLDSGANVWLTVGSEVFMRGQVTVYLKYRTHEASIDPGTIASYARAQDELLLAAAAAGTPIGVLASTPVPPQPATRPEICG